MTRLSVGDQLEHLARKVAEAHERLDRVGELRAELREELRDEIQVLRDLIEVGASVQSRRISDLEQKR